MDKAATNNSRTTRRATRPAAAPRRARRTAPTRTVTKPVPQPTFTRLTTNVELTPPVGCIATVVLKQIAHSEGTRYYKWWLMVGRNGDDASSVHYKHTGEDMIRCDIPTGMPLSEDALLPGLKAFWAKQPNLPGDGDVGTGGGHGGSGGTHTP